MAIFMTKRTTDYIEWQKIRYNFCHRRLHGKKSDIIFAIGGYMAKNKKVEL